MNLENKDVDGILQYADPVIAAILNKAISGKDVTSREALILFDAKGIDFQLVGKVADYLRNDRQLFRSHLRVQPRSGCLGGSPPERALVISAVTGAGE